MKRLLLTTLLLLSGLCTSAYAEEHNTFHVYLAGKLGYSATLIDLKDTTTQKKKRSNLSSFNIGTAFGGQYYFMKPFGLRIEFEYLFRTKDKTQQSRDILASVGITTHTIFTNIYLDWHIIPQLAIYTQGGIGVSIMSIEQEGAHSGSGSSYGNFVWQAGLGTWYAVKKDTILDLTVRYVGYSTPHLTNISVRSLSGIDVIFSFRYLF
ncbi:MAG: outer membrane beta-barrel protein [Desulfovibrionaceae bacterium]|nr:outer membrane beta-barrel protein [Desulfovibrionaceae bacterium]